ncbi:MAG: two-component system NtrC family sensor kinase [Paraglaciecola sp.]|jgi:two-component system NtrC family sensor kinase
MVINTMFEFWRFKSVSTEIYKIIEGDYNYFLVFLSFLVSSFAAYAFLVVLERTWQVNTNRALTLWKILGSVVFGLGIWAMHFTGMLAFMLPAPMSFNIAFTLLSVITPIIGAYFSIRLLASKDFSFVMIQWSALYLSIGIGSMHFIGMEAMTVEATMYYDPVYFIASIFTAHLLATVAIYLIKGFHRTTQYILVSKVLSSIVMGAAVASMHYVAMSAVSFYTHIDNLLVEYTMYENATVFSLAIAVIVIIIVATTILCALIEDKLLKAELTIEQGAIREKDIVEHMADGFLTFNSSGIVESINPSGVLMFGYEREALIGCKLHSFMKSEKIKQLSVMSLDEALQDYLGQTFIALGVKQDGSEFPIEVNFSKIPFLTHSQTLFNCVARDVTHRSELEAQLRQSQKLESIGQLSAGIAHEINTPTQYVSDNINFLGVAFDSCLKIICKTQTIINKDISQVTQKEIDDIKTIFQEDDMDFVLDEIPLAIKQTIEGLQRVKKIIAAMKSFSHPNQGEMSLVDITEAIESTKTVSRSEWRYIAELATNYSKNLPKINCLRDEFNQVILNFIVNAAHAIEEKYGQKSATMGCINIDVYQQHNNIKIMIKDDGIGMSTEVKDRVFDPFFTTKVVGKGTGQGLSLAYLVIVEKHKGTIEVKSELNVGTTFTISIPIT